jgi:hypothetical protein
MRILLVAGCGVLVAASLVGCASNADTGQSTTDGALTKAGASKHDGIGSAGDFGEGDGEARSGDREKGSGGGDGLGSSHGDRDCPGTGLHGGAGAPSASAGAPSTGAAGASTGSGGAAAEPPPK